MRILGRGGGGGLAQAVDSTRLERVQFTARADITTGAWYGLSPIVGSAAVYVDGSPTGTETEIIEQVTAADRGVPEIRLSKGGTYLFTLGFDVTGEQDRSSPMMRLLAADATTEIARSPHAYCRFSGERQPVRLLMLAQVSNAQAEAGVGIQLSSANASTDSPTSTSNNGQFDMNTNATLQVARWGGGDGADGPNVTQVNNLIQAAITALVGTAPANRNTLGELSDAIDAVPSGGGGGLTQGQVNALIEAITDPLSNRVSTNTTSVSTAFSRITDLEGGVPAHVLAQRLTYQFDSSDTNPPGDYEFYRHSDSSISLVLSSDADDRAAFRGAKEMYINNRYTRVTGTSITNGVRYTLDGTSVESDEDVLTIHLARYQTAAETSVDASGFDGQLATTDNTVQKVAQKVDDLTLSGGGITQQQATNLILQWARTGNTSQIPDAKIPTGIARDTEVTAAIQQWARAADTSLIPENKIHGDIARDSEVTAAIATWARAANTSLIPENKIHGDIARDSEVTAAINALIDSAPANRNTLKELSDAIDAVDASSGLDSGEIGTFTFSATGGDSPASGTWTRQSATQFSVGISDADLRFRFDGSNDTHAHIWIDDDRVRITASRRLASSVQVTVQAGYTLPTSGELKLYWDQSPPLAEDVTLVTTNFDRNLDSTITTVQQLADAVDNLVLAGPTQAPATERVLYGVVAQSVDTEAEIRPLLGTSAFSVVTATVAGHDITIGPTTATGQRFVFVVPRDHDIVSLVNTATNTNERSSYTRTAWAAQYDSADVNGYVSDPLRNGVSINYRLTLQE